MTNIPETGRSTRVQTRLVVIQILVLSLLATLGGRLWYLQIRQGDEYAEEASGNHVPSRSSSPPTRRARSWTPAASPSPTTRPGSSSPPPAPTC
ncbi:hypothetical protein SVIOM342S_07200 [Streptomyces violaceorubidus]